MIKRLGHSAPLVHVITTVNELVDVVNELTGHPASLHTPTPTNPDGSPMIDETPTPTPTPITPTPTNPDGTPAGNPDPADVPPVPLPEATPIDVDAPTNPDGTPAGNQGPPAPDTVVGAWVTILRARSIKVIAGMEEAMDYLGHNTSTVI